MTPPPKQKKKPPEQKKLRILVVAKQNRLGLRLAAKLEKELSAYPTEISFDRSTALRLRRIGKQGTSLNKFDGDFIITVGGDGTLLWTAHQTGKPVLPVRIEGHGFLCTIDYKDLLENLAQLMEGKYEISERIRLRCSKVSKGVFEEYLTRILPRGYPHALNEIVFARKRPSKILEIEFTIDGTLFDFRGDGILISTPAGSTAYSASAGGPLIDPDLAAICIVPLYPFYSKVKPIIVPADKKIDVRIKAGECALIVDGHGGDYVKAGAQFVVDRGAPLQVIKLVRDSFYARFKSKFL